MSIHWEYGHISGGDSDDSLTKLFKRTDDLDSSTLHCPCGDGFTWSTEVEDLYSWISIHAPHVKGWNGKR